MTNLKDRISNICAVVLAVCGAIISVSQSGVTLPDWIIPCTTITAAIAGAIIGVLTGKNPELK